MGYQYIMQLTVRLHCLLRAFPCSLSPTHLGISRTEGSLTRSVSLQFSIESPSSSAGDRRSIVIAMAFLGSPDIPQPASMSALLTFVSRPRGQADYLDAQASERDGNDET